MTAISTAALEHRMTSRWRRILDSAGRQTACRDLGPEPTASEGAMQADIAELFVRAEPAERRSFDLFLAVLATFRGGRGPKLLVAGPDTIRSRSQPSPSGTAVTELPVVPRSAELAAISVLLLRVPRRPRIRALTASVEDLARMVDVEHDPDGSAAAADAAVRRLEVLVHSDGVRAALAGEVPVPVAPGYQLLADPAAASPVTAVRDGRLVGTATGEGPWRAGDFALIRFGPPRPRADEGRSLDTLRRESALVEVELEVGAPDEEETYTTRVARARQSSRAAQIVGFARTEDRADAVRTLRAALAQPAGSDPLAESLMSRVSRAEDFWRVRDVLLDAETDPDLAGSLRVTLATVRRRYERRLDALVSSVPRTDLDESDPLPGVMPIVVEVSDALVPIVDSRQDGGLFLETLIPRAKERVAKSLGVTLPGFRLRGNPNLPPGVFQPQVFEVPAPTEHVVLYGAYALTPVDTLPEPPFASLSDFHPLTGAPGLFTLQATDGEEEPGERLSAPQYLIHRLERALRPRAHQFVSPQEVDVRLQEWRADDETGLVAGVIADSRARERLTWVLRALLRDGVPTTDWRAILEAIRNAGGTDAPIRALRRAARVRLREQLPGARRGARLVHLPEELATDALGPPRIELLEWLRTTVARTGPAISIVTATQDQREAVARVTQGFDPLIRTFSSDELDGDGG